MVTTPGEWTCSKSSINDVFVDNGLVAAKIYEKKYSEKGQVNLWKTAFKKLEMLSFSCLSKILLSPFFEPFVPYCTP